MNGRQLTDVQIARALRAKLPEHAQADLPGRILADVATTSQQRALPSIFGGLGDADPVARRRTLLLAAALLAALAVISSAVIGSRLLERDSPLPPNLASGGWVAYVMQPGLSGDGPADIYLVREGAAPRLIVGGNYEHGHNGCPTFSPDGSRLAYAEALTHEADGTWSSLAVVVIEVDGGGSRVGSEIRIPVPGASGLPCPKWSPDGERVAYGIMGETGFAGLAVTNVVENSTVVLASDDRNWGPFAWSPAGDVLAVIEGAGDIWLVPTNGGEPRLLREGSFGELAWSPDGSRIAAMMCPSLCGRDVVHVLRVDGTTADIELGPGEHPVWSPNGDRLAYIATVEPSAGSSARTVVVADADGGNARSLPYVSDDPGEEPWGLASGVRWSPDGRHLLYIGHTRFPTRGYAPVSISAAGDAPPVTLAPPSMDLYAAHETDLSWQPVLP